MQCEFLNYEIKGKTAIISINRPKVYNALSKAAKHEIVQAIKQANKDSHVLSIILTGVGKAFSTGQDLNDRTVNAGAGAVDLGITLETEWNPLVNTIRNSPKIVIAAINGVVAGAGLSVALACDLLTAAPGVQFISGFSKLGLTCDAGSTYTLTRALGGHKALEFFLTNDPLSAEELQHAGVISQVDENFLDCALKLAAKINCAGPLAVPMIKKNIQQSMESTYKESMAKETAGQRFLGNSNDYQEGLKAFFEKRPANFKGL